MTFQELYELNQTYADIDRLVDVLSHDPEAQLVLQTDIAESNGDEGYWLLNNLNTTANNVPIASWCFTSEPRREDIQFRDWQELREKIFELVTDEVVIEYYLESV